MYCWPRKGADDGREVAVGGVREGRLWGEVDGGGGRKFRGL